MSDETHRLAIESGWLVEVVNHHTCGTGPNGYYGAHEPGCGSIPICRVEDIEGFAAHTAEAKRQGAEEALLRHDVLWPALLEYQAATDHYLRGSHTTEPTEHDLCCDYHRWQWEREEEVQSSLRERRAAIDAALNEIQQARERQEGGSE